VGVGVTGGLGVEREREGEDGDEGKGAGTGKKKVKKRNKWTEQETKDLLRGVAKFGIGNWKRILECQEFVFRERTSVDLKDRFRTCCPDEYSKYRASDSSNPATPSKPTKRSHKPKDVNTKSLHYYGLHPPQIEPSEAKAPRRPRSNTDRKGPAELAEMGIDRPFFKNKRRERREFTERDDEALIRGFEKHGPVWHNIRSDPELGFGARHPTDLRDRFRTRFPERYAQAGYKVKPKDAQKQRDRSGGTKPDSKDPTTSDHQPTKPAPNRLDAETPSSGSTTQPTTTNTTIPTPSDSRSKPHSLLKPLLTTFPGPFDDFPDLASEDEASYSPITLSRNIFQWADAHPPAPNSNSNSTNAHAHATANATANAIAMPALAAADITSHLSFGLLAGMDQYHVNPLATLNLPPAAAASGGAVTTATTAGGAAGAFLLSSAPSSMTAGVGAGI
ncbi:hypothetical protein AOQ84DRAFT_366816, partial [Glonium stellatum]